MRTRCCRFVAAALGVAAFATTGLWSACAADAATGQLPGVGNANAVAVDASGRIITAGNSFDFLLARFKRSGALDKSFGLGGKVITKFGDKEAAANDLAIDSSGRIVAAGFAGKRVALARYKRNGSLDKTFGRRGKVTTQLGRPPGENIDDATALALDGSGKIVIAGYVSSSRHYGSPWFVVARYMPNGTLDPKFGTGGVVETDFGALTSEAHSVAIDRAGKIVAAGVAQDVSGGLHAAIARYDRRGRLDPTFGSGGEVTTPASFDPFDLAIDSLGRIIVVGAGSPEYGLVRYDASGALDPSFGSGGTVNSELGLSALALTPSNAIIAAGAAASFPSPPTPYRKFALARYSSGGSLDPTFGSGGEVATDFGRGGEGASADDVAIDPSGRIVAAGVFTVNGLVGDTRLALARYNPSGSLDTTFGSGGLVTTAFPPETEIFKAEIAASRGRATFFYTALGNDASWLFQCALLSRPTSKPKFRNCGGSKRYSHLKPGRYTFEVRAVGVAGPDPTPAKRRFRIR